VFLYLNNSLKLNPSSVFHGNYGDGLQGKRQIKMEMYGNLVLGNEKHLQTTAGSSSTQLEQSRTGVADDLPVSTPCHLPCSSTASSSVQATSMAPQRPCEVLLSAKEYENLIAQFFGTKKIVQSCYTCPSKLCNSLRQEEIARLKQHKKKYIHTWHQEKANWWLCFVEGEGMFCLLCKKHAIKTVQNKEESAFTQTASMRLKYDTLKVHRDSDRHCKAVNQELLQRMSVFRKEVVKQKETAKEVLEKAFSVAYFLAKEHVAIRKFLNLIKFAEDSLGVNHLKYFNHKSEGSIREIFLVLGETIKEEIVRSAQKVQSYGLMVDEVTDISVQSQMLTFIQFVSPLTSCIEIAFLSVQNVLEEFASANADALTSLIKDELQQCGLSLTNLKGLVTDGAAVMTGRNNGVATKLKELNPVLISVHCICHKLALA